MGTHPTPGRMARAMSANLGEGANDKGGGDHLPRGGGGAIQK